MLCGWVVGVEDPAGFVVLAAVVGVGGVARLVGHVCAPVRSGVQNGLPERISAPPAVTRTGWWDVTRPTAPSLTVAVTSRTMPGASCSLAAVWGRSRTMTGSSKPKIGRAHV